MGKGGMLVSVYLQFWGLLCTYCSCDVCGGGLVCVCVCAYSLLVLYIENVCIHTEYLTFVAGKPSTFEWE